MRTTESDWCARAAQQKSWLVHVLCAASLGSAVVSCGRGAKPTASITQAAASVHPPAASATPPAPPLQASSAAARSSGRIPFIATACGLRPGFGTKSLTLDARKRPSIDYYSRPEIHTPPEEAHCEVYQEGSERSSPVFGKVLTLYDGTWGKCSVVSLVNRHFTLGWGARSECGSVLYEGVISMPSTATTSGPLRLGGLETTHLTFEDHRARSPRCKKVDSPLILREDAQAADGLQVKRVRYAGRATRPLPAVPLEPRLEPLPICVLFDRPEQTADREPEPCELGTYFLEDDSADGKFVQLEDWVEGTCDAPRGVPIGRRLYPLGSGKVDACGTIIYGATDEGQASSLFGSFGSLVFGVEMRDHRFRKESARCPAPPALVELLEKVYRGSVSDTLILERRFYAPRFPMEPSDGQRAAGQ